MPGADGWDMASAEAAGFAADLDDRFDVARQAGLLPNVHGVVAARGGRIFFERYLPAPMPPSAARSA